MLWIAILLASFTNVGGRVTTPPCALSAAPTVQLDRATVTGIASETVNKFLGIPFAQPPTGQLRLRVPQPLPPYESDFYATDSGPACPQLYSFSAEQASRIGLMRHATSANDDDDYSEDCLTLNVVTPTFATPASKLPVVVWIYGGGFTIGSKSEPIYDGTVIVDKSLSLLAPVVYVAINYRLNIFGFLASREIEEAGVGNLGLRDQRLALRWLQQYISAFGGDPAKVTIWGESAGGMSVAYQMLTNGGDNEGLFRAAFIQSGPPLNGGAMISGQPYYNILVDLVGCSGATDTLQCLRDAPYESLVAAIHSPELLTFGLKSPWTPRIDGEFLSASPYDLVLQDSAANIPFVIGVCDDEATIPTSSMSSSIRTDAEVAEYLRTEWMFNSPPEMVPRVMEYYPADPFQGSPFDTCCFNQLDPQFKRLSAFHGDIMFQSTSRLLWRHLSSKQDTWAYIYKRNKTVPIYGASHGFDIPDIFGGSDMTSYLVRLAANLDPNVGTSHTDIYWPKLNDVNHTMLAFLDADICQCSRGPTTVELGFGYQSAQVPVQAPIPRATQALTTDTYREDAIEYVFRVAYANPF